MARRATFWVAAGFALLVSHDAVFLAQVGPGQELVGALRGAGHGYWGLASTLVLVGAVIGAAIWVVRIAVLRRLAANTPGHGRALGDWRRRAISHWIRLFVLVAVAFTVQENAEHVLSHGHLIGTGALLGPEYPLALPVLALVTGLAAAFTAVVREHEAQLLRRIGAARARVWPLRRIGPARWVPTRVGERAPMSAHRALRAPPPAFLHA